MVTWPVWQLTKMDKKKGGLAEGTLLSGLPPAESHGRAVGVFSETAALGGCASMPGGPHVCCARGRCQDESLGAECQVVRVGEDKAWRPRGDVD